jgi:hypothetical protein
MKKMLAAALVALTFVGFFTPSASHALGVYGIWWMPDDSDEDGYGVGLKNLDNAFGWYVLLGAEIAVRKWGIFGEIKWQSLDPDLDLPSGGSANLDALAIHIGATVDRLFN